MAEFEVELGSVYPTESDKIHEITQDLRLHHLELSNAVKDSELIAQSTKDRLRRSYRVLSLREKLLEKGRLPPEAEVKLWKQAVGKLRGDVESSLDLVK